MHPIAQTFRCSICVTALLAWALFSRVANAEPLQNFAAAMHSHFAELRALPILLPEDEQPGDIYINPARGFIARRDLCFSAEPPSKSTETRLYQVASATQHSIGGSLGAQMYKIINVTASGDYRYAEEVRIGFSEQTISSYTQTALKRMLRNTNERCAKALDEVRDAEGAYPYVERVPWILRSVITAKMSADLSYRVVRGAQVDAELENEISKAVGDIGIKVHATSEKTGSINVPGGPPLPVAYEPAFISLEDLERLQELDDPSLWQKVVRFIHGDDRQETLQQIQQKLPKTIIVPPEQMYEQMSWGQPIAYDTNNEDHVEYMRRRNLLLAVSHEMHPEAFLAAAK